MKDGGKNCFFPLSVFMSYPSDCSAFGAEAVYGTGNKGISRLQHHAREIRMMDGIGMVLGFQGQPGHGAVVLALMSDGIEMLSGIKLNTGF